MVRRHQSKCDKTPTIGVFERAPPELMIRVFARCKIASHYCATMCNIEHCQQFGSFRAQVRVLARTVAKFGRMTAAERHDLCRLGRTTSRFRSSGAKSLFGNSN